MDIRLSPTIELLDQLRQLLSEWMNFAGSDLVISCLMLVVIAIAAVGGYYITVLILHLVARMVEYTETDWDDDLINEKLLKSISQLTPAIVVAWMLPGCFEAHDTFASLLKILTSFYIIGVSVYAVCTFLDNLFEAFSRRPKLQPYAVTGIFQMLKLIIIGIGVIIAVSLLVGKSPVAILTALGASAAILMLVFKDTIMGLVASVQLSANKMVQRGDWIVVPKHNANGQVIDITLTTVKIKNWDNSITTVPPYSLVSDSFQNFQAMKEDGARRISRAVYIDINSVRYLSRAEIRELHADGLIHDLPENPDINLTIFRNYLEGWIACRPEVRTDCIYMVRQLAPTPEGVPLELYFFLKVTEWKSYEHIQSDIFNHVYAVAPRFGLRIFQAPSGLDLRHTMTADRSALPPSGN